MMGRKTKYQKERQEAIRAFNDDDFPHRIKTGSPLKLMASLGRFFRGKNINSIGLSSDPDGNAIWLSKRK